VALRSRTRGWTTEALRPQLRGVESVQVRLSHVRVRGASGSGGVGHRLRHAVAGLVATFMIAGLFGGVLGLVAGEASAATLPACTTSSTTTCAVKLTLTSGIFGVHNRAPANLSPPVSLTGHLDPKTGVISGGTLSPITYHVHTPTVTSPTTPGSTENITISQPTPGAGTGSINSLGDLTYEASLKSFVTLYVPIHEQCYVTPINVVLSSSAPVSSGAVTISQSDFHIPPVTRSISNCALAGGTLDKKYSGTVNEMSLSLSGATLPLPPPPAKPTTTSLTVSPPSPVLVGTPVTLTASVSATGAVAKDATGTISFMSGPTVLESVATTTGKATLTTSALPAQPGQALTAVYSGNTKYGSSTSTAQSYSVQPKPTISTNLPATLITGTATPTPFTVTVTNPSTGREWTPVKLAIAFANISNQRSTNVTLTYENSAGTWCPLPLSSENPIRGTFKGLTGACGSTSNFSLPAGTSLTIHFRIKYASAANVGTQRALFSLNTVNSTGTAIAPFTAATTTTVPINAPYLFSSIQVNPATKYPLILTTDPTVTAVPSGYQFYPFAGYKTPPKTPTTNTDYPTPSGKGVTFTFLIDGHTFTPPIVLTNTDSPLLQGQSIPTTGLSLGSHTLTVVFSGNGVYAPASITQPFTVVAAAPGTVYSCTRNGVPIAGSVIVSGALPQTSNTGTAKASLITSR
jgi:hypothetical protein